MESFSNAITLPDPELGNLPDIEHVIRIASSTPGGREALSKFLLREDYVAKIIPLVEMSEDLESLQDLHKLCNVMKSLILLNDNAIIEHLVTDEIITGVVGALEYDPDFPTHKANHRQYLNDTTRYKEVVPIRDPMIQKKIRHTWRLQYLKDVVLARILDDPTFSVLNSIIFFHQVDIVQHLQGNATFLKELFAVFDAQNHDIKRREDGVHFLHQCAAIAKNLQAPARANLFANFISHGLFNVITFAMKHPNPSMRTTGIDILVALLDHDPMMMRGYMLKAVHEKKSPLTDTMIQLIHAETDLGVKNQLADAIKILLDPQAPGQEAAGNRNGGEFMSKISRQPQISPSQAANEQFAQDHFDGSCKRLFRPLRDLRERKTMQDFTYQEVSLHTHLVEILTYFVRSHSIRSRHFVLSEKLPARVAQLLRVSQKPLKLTALKFFRTCVGLQDQFYVNQMMQNSTFEFILDIVIETMPRDNLLNSACLEMFEFIKRETIKNVILHVVDKYRDKVKDITYVDTFQELINRYEQMQGYNPDMEQTLFSQDDDSPSTARNHINGGQRWQGIKEMDSEQEEYFNTSDDDEEGTLEREEANKTRSDRFEWHSRRLKMGGIPNGHTRTSNASANAPSMSAGKPLVDYPDDEDDLADENMNVRPVLTPHTPGTPESISSEKENTSPESITNTTSTTQRRLQPSPDIPEKIAEKRRREEDEDDDDELSKLSTGVKRRNSTSSHSTSASSFSGLKRKKSLLRSKQQQQQQQQQQQSGHGAAKGEEQSSNPPERNSHLSVSAGSVGGSATGSATGASKKKIAISLSNAGAAAALRADNAADDVAGKLAQKPPSSILAAHSAPSPSPSSTTTTTTTTAVATKQLRAARGGREVGNVVVGVCESEVDDVVVVDDDDDDDDEGGEAAS
jgi:protein phosphatase 4 regulatory subunit 3